MRTRVAATSDWITSLTKNGFGVVETAFAVIVEPHIASMRLFWTATAPPPNVSSR